MDDCRSRRRRVVLVFLCGRSSCDPNRPIGSKDLFPLPPGLILGQLCKDLDKINVRPSPNDPIYKCFAESIKDTGVVCTGSISGFVRCLKQNCSTLGSNVIYNDPAFCSQGVRCATHGKGNAPGDCKIVICLDQMGNRNCRDLGGDPNVPCLPFNFIHEALHCCGLEHGKMPPKNDPTLPTLDPPRSIQCNDALACCVWHAMYGGSQNPPETPEDWIRKCKRHVPQRED